jgi:hypothetical protein
VATNACGSVGERVVRGSRIRLFHDGRESMQRSMEVPGTGKVELLGPGGNVVGTGVLEENIKCGMELNAVKLCLFELYKFKLYKFLMNLCRQGRLLENG